jgi:hypothetical protein
MRDVRGHSAVLCCAHRLVTASKIMFLLLAVVGPRVGDAAVVDRGDVDSHINAGDADGLDDGCDRRSGPDAVRADRVGREGLPYLLISNVGAIGVDQP